MPSLGSWIASCGRRVETLLSDLIILTVNGKDEVLLLVTVYLLYPSRPRSRCFRFTVSSLERIFDEYGIHALSNGQKTP